MTKEIKRLIITILEEDGQLKPTAYYQVEENGERVKEDNIELANDVSVIYTTIKSSIESLENI